VDAGSYTRPMIGERLHHSRGQACFAVVLMVAVPILAGCLSPGATVSTGPRQTTIIGRLAGDGTCAWLETGAGQRIEVAYPDGWRLELDPLALYDDGGHLHASEGDTLMVEGYFGEMGASVCDPEQIFLATAVSAAADAPVPASSRLSRPVDVATLSRWT
jgi:hypothetical protein